MWTRLWLNKKEWKTASRKNILPLGKVEENIVLLMCYDDGLRTHFMSKFLIHIIYVHSNVMIEQSGIRRTFVYKSGGKRLEGKI